MIDRSLSLQKHVPKVVAKQKSSPNQRPTGGWMSLNSRSLSDLSAPSWARRMIWDVLKSRQPKQLWRQVLPRARVEAPPAGEAQDYHLIRNKSDRFNPRGQSCAMFKTHWVTWRALFCLVTISLCHPVLTWTPAVSAISALTGCSRLDMHMEVGSWKLKAGSTLHLRNGKLVWAVLRGTRQHVAKSAQLDLGTEVFMMFVTFLWPFRSNDFRKHWRPAPSLSHHASRKNQNCKIVSKFHLPTFCVLVPSVALRHTSVRPSATCLGSHNCLESRSPFRICASAVFICI